MGKRKTALSASGERTTKTERALKALGASSLQEEAAGWFLRAWAWSQDGYRDPLPATATPRLVRMADGSAEYVRADDIILNLDRAQTWRTLRGFATTKGREAWDVMTMLLVRQWNFTAIGQHYRPELQQRMARNVGKLLCQNALTLLAAWRGEVARQRAARPKASHVGAQLRQGVHPALYAKPHRHSNVAYS
ncbi:hypothetical protein E3E12_08065 [Formicincola oecophyllae]|uniref:Uncharacterized protein n=1 Tax=Formicincola oecophyllae TaxID=2558361 RepID=A0A4Y6UCN3_9PROT|nr:hypothetical protein [Formicincola oecophyllae]QDH14151.1 hypothetical protein E3E12_08065 [Formicincola oecophyllae]